MQGKLIKWEKKGSLSRGLVQSLLLGGDTRHATALCCSENTKELQTIPGRMAGGCGGVMCQTGICQNLCEEFLTDINRSI